MSVNGDIRCNIWVFSQTICTILPVNLFPTYFGGNSWLILCQEFTYWPSDLFPTYIGDIFWVKISQKLVEGSVRSVSMCYFDYIGGQLISIVFWCQFCDKKITPK